MKPKIRIHVNSKCEISQNPHKEWLKGNMFRITIIQCWMDFLNN